MTRLLHRSFSLQWIAILPFLFCAVLATAQPINDACTGAIPLTDISDWCSNAGEFSNINATDEGPSASCFPNTQPNNDVWFSFVAEATTVNISVAGNTGSTGGGSLAFPQFAIYDGTCGTLNQLACTSDAIGINVVEIFEANLQVGQTYYIQVSARNGNTGTFQLCINNFNEVPSPSSDCEPGVILCDKSPFTVQNVTGVGSVTGEIGNVGCNSFGCQLSESGSAWYKWTCDEAGSLTFSLTPLNPVDDLDFVLYELPNGVNDCSGKFDLRCMASGEVVGAPLDVWEPCTGETGLSLNDGDINESCGCSEGDNNFVSAIDMVPGVAYALVINNFSQSGSGFSVSFGGMGTFLGPEAAFQTSPNLDTFCIGSTVTFTDASTFSGGLSGWQWDFGEGAVPASASGPGPHSVTYSTPGLKSIVLQVETSDGCIVTEISNIYVECCDGMFTVNSLVTSPLCPGLPIGAIDLDVQNDNPPYTYEWSNGATTQDLQDLEPGTYTLTLTDNFSCDTVLTYEVTGPEDFDVETIVGIPTCNGGLDGSITLNITGGTAPYQYSWQNGPFTNDNFLNNIPVGEYDMTMQDANGCELVLTIPVDELELQLDPTAEIIVNPSCTGFSDGSLSVVIGNGAPPYQYDFNDGLGFVTDNIANGLPAGTYTVDVLDANLCIGQFILDLEDPPLLEVSLDVEGISCFGAMDGALTAVATGGVGGYTYEWGGGQTSQTINELDVGIYAVTVTDANGCVADINILLDQPAELFLNIDSVLNALCFGEASGLIDVVASGGSSPFEYSLDGFTYQVSDVFPNLLAGEYTITVLDANGCTASVDTFLTQPAELIVDAGPDVQIELGYDTLLQAVANDFPVTFSWSPPDSLSCLDCPNPITNPVNTTTYTVTVFDEVGCPALDSVTVVVLKNRPLYVPNGFSPNNDGRNDGFTVFAGPGVRRVVRLRVFNRWGGMVFDGGPFQPNDPTFGWDGTFKGEPASIDVYAYYAEVEFIDGVVILVEGDVQLVR